MFKKFRRWLINCEISVNQKDIADLEKLLVDNHHWLSLYDAQSIKCDIISARLNIRHLKNKLNAL
jgi:hypothetical protein